MTDETCSRCYGQGLFLLYRKKSDGTCVADTFRCDCGAGNIFASLFRPAPRRQSAVDVDDTPGSGVHEQAEGGGET